MSKSCPSCDPNSDGHNYMNIEGKSEIVLGEGETLIPNEDGLKASKINKSPKHREADETVPSEATSDIFTKIQLANQKAKEFLENLEFEEDNHGE